MISVRQAGVRQAGDWLGRVVFVGAIAFLAFVAGSLMVLSDVPPGPFVRSAWKAGWALWYKETKYIDRYQQTDLWHKARTSARGVTTADPPGPQPGYTLYTSGDSSHALLVDMKGNVVHEWKRSYSTVWNERAAVKKPQPDNMTYMRKAHLFPNGDLLVIYEAAGDTPWGYGMVKLDRHSNVIWSYLQHTHHDFDIGPDGRIYLLTNDFTSERLKSLGFLARPRLDDFLVILSPDGKELKKISLTKAFARSPYNRLLYAIPQFSLEDPLHTNTVFVIDPAHAAAFPFGQPGQVMLSFRDIGAIVVLDVEREVVTWVLRGSWIGQHDTHLLADGHILMFDNFGNLGDHGFSRVLEIDPKTQAIVWHYDGEDGHSLASELRGSAEREPNGNTLITEDDGGRIFEVTPQDRIVWEYVNPLRGGEGQQYIPIASFGQRIDPNRLDPDFRNLIAQGKSAEESK